MRAEKALFKGSCDGEQRSFPRTVELAVFKEFDSIFQTQKNFSTPKTFISLV
jgi:hypothetical protein